MQSDDDAADDLTGLSEAPSGPLDSVEHLLARVAASPPAPLLGEGTRIGRYVLLIRLGAGAMGVVWAAYDPQLDRKVALKILKRSASGPAGTEARERASREARALAKLVHPHIVAVHDGGLDGDTLYVVMELVDGVTLRAHLAERPRSVEQVLDLFAQAGAGLAAAHDAKLVHRDFKPDNVLVGHDGRVRVADFGLARIAGVADAAADAPTPSTTPVPAPVPAPLTATAAVVGTLPYMAPEQLEVGPVDHRVDQFAFAVALWDALHGGLPFGGDTVASRRAAIVAGPVTRLDARKVPSWLRAILRRALAVGPDDRFATMHDLLGAIARGRGRRGRIAAAAVAVLAVGAIAPALWWARSEAAEPPCESGAATIAQVWTPERAVALDALFPAAGAEAAAALRGRLDGYARDWATTHRAACRATEVDRTQSAEMLDRRMVCLERARARLDGTLAWISGADVDPIADVIPAIDELPPLERCSDIDALSGLIAMPGDAATRARIKEVVDELERVYAGVHDPVRRDHTGAAKTLLDHAESTGWAPLIAESSLAYADALYNAQENQTSIPVYRDAVRWGLQGGDVAFTAGAMNDLAWTLSGVARDPEARTWIKLGRALAARVGDPADLTLQLTSTSAEVERNLGDRRQAFLEALAAVPIASAPGLRAGSVGRAYRNLAIVYTDLGRHDLAIPLLQRAVEQQTRELGAGHPGVAASYNSLAGSLNDAGRPDEALAAVQQALAIREVWYGEDDLELAHTHVLMAVVQQRRRDADASRTSFERALAVMADKPDADPRMAAEIEGNLAVLEAMAGRYDVAIERGSDALARLETIMGTEHPSLANPLLVLGWNERARGNLDASAAYLTRSVALAEQLGASHPETVNPRIELGNTEVARGRLPEAIALFERVRALGAADSNIPRYLVAEASMALAEALARTGALPRARRVAAEARDLYAGLGEAFIGQRDAAVAWLAAH